MFDIFFEVEREGGDFLTVVRGGYLEHFAGHGFLEAVNAGDAVLHFEDRPYFLDVEGAEIGSFDFSKEDVLDLAGTETGLGGHLCWCGA